MYKVGDYIMHETSGVCQVKEIQEKALHGKGSERMYYSLEPVFDRGASVITPVDSKSRIRDVKSPDEFEALLAGVGELDIVKEEGNRARTEKFKEKIALFDPKQLASVVKSIYLHQKMRLASGKKAMSSDERVMDLAAQRLFEEMAFAMKTDIDTVKHAFFGKLDGQEI